MPLTTDQLETLVRQSKEPRWCICVDPENCDQLMPAAVRTCRAKALLLPRITKEAIEAMWLDSFDREKPKP